MKTVSLDTNVLLRLLIEDVPKQAQQARELIRQPFTFRVSDLAISEFCFVTDKLYGLTRAETVERLEFLLRLPNISCNRGLFEQALPLYATHPALSFIDCCLAIQAELNDAVPLYTFDKKLANQSGGRAQLIA